MGPLLVLGQDIHDKWLDWPWVSDHLDLISEDVREAATGVGLSGRGRLVRIELPLAIPAIVAGIRIATVTTIGLVTVTSVIGQQNLGELMFTNGFQRNFRTPV